LSSKQTIDNSGRVLEVVASTTNHKNEEKGILKVMAKSSYLTNPYPSGSFDGCLGERKDLNAFPYIVRRVPAFSTYIQRRNDYNSSSNNPASLTSRLGATIDVEQNHVRFLGDLILNLWDCGGQDAFMDAYLTAQRSTIFQHVGVMIYVFDVETREMHKDLEYYRDCLDGLQQFSPGAAVFLLIHKMDLVRGNKATVLEKKKTELRLATGDVRTSMFGTSIHDESLYKVRTSLHPDFFQVSIPLSRHGQALCIP
jgi:Gtr1/RagA G protein conserved region